MSAQFFFFFHIYNISGDIDKKNKTLCIATMSDLDGNFKIHKEKGGIYFDEKQNNYHTRGY